MIFSIPELDATGRLEHKGTNSKKDAIHEKIKFDANIMEDSREGSPIVKEVQTSWKSRAGGEPNGGSRESTMTTD